jgi:hypothetical protein
MSWVSQNNHMLTNIKQGKDETVEGSFENVGGWYRSVGKMDQNKKGSTLWG